MTRERRLTLETKEGSDATNGAPGIATRSKKLLGTQASLLGIPWNPARAHQASMPAVDLQPGPGRIQSLGE